MKTLTVRVQNDHLLTLSRAKKPILAMAELIWNDLDAEAKRVDAILQDNDLRTLETIRVRDDGHSIAYDALNRLTNLTAKVGYATRAAFTYALDADGIRTNLSETVNSQSRAYAWGYDNLRRLESETITGATPTGTVTYQYDGVGNRTNRTSTLAGVSSATYAYDSNDRLTTDSYDSAGNTTNSSGNVYEYDIDGREKVKKGQPVNINIVLASPDGCGYQ